MMVPRFMLVTPAVGITEADLSIPLRGLNWIATLPSLNIARTLGEPSGTYRFVRNAIYVPFSITIHLRPVLVEAESPCVLDLADYILTYNSACCDNILTASNKLTPRTVSAHRLGSVGRRTVYEVSRHSPSSECEEPNPARRQMFQTRLEWLRIPAVPVLFRGLCESTQGFLLECL